MKRIILLIICIVLISIGTLTTFVQGKIAAETFLEQAKTKIASLTTLPAEPKLTQLITEQSKTFGIDEILVHAIIQVESRGLNATRFEAHKFDSDKSNQTSFEKAMQNSSHGVMQVMGYNAKFCDMTWQDLYQPKLGLSCGLKLLKDCIQRNGSNLTKALGCYNGDPVNYPNKVKIALGEKLLSTMKIPLNLAERNNFKSKT